MVFLNEFFQKKMNLKNNSADERMHEKLPSMKKVKSIDCKINLNLFVRDCTCAILFVILCQSNAKVSLHWSVIHHQVTF